MARRGHRPMTRQPAQPLTPCPTAKTNRYKKKPSFHPAPHPILKFYDLKQPQSTSISQNSQKFLENNFFENSQTLGPDPTSCVKKTQRRHPITVHTPSPLSHPPAPPVDNSTAPPRALERPLARPNAQDTNLCPSTAQQETAKRSYQPQAPSTGETAFSAPRRSKRKSPLPPLPSKSFMRTTSLE